MWQCPTHVYTVAIQCNLYAHAMSLSSIITPSKQWYILGLCWQIINTFVTNVSDDPFPNENGLHKLACWGTKIINHIAIIRTQHYCNTIIVSSIWVYVCASTKVGWLGGGEGGQREESIWMLSRWVWSYRRRSHHQGLTSLFSFSSWSSEQDCWSTEIELIIIKVPS